MDEEKKQIGCTGHCENCNMTQRVYCAAQIGLYNQKEIAEIKANQEKILVALESFKPVTEELCTLHSLGPTEKVPMPTSE